jgi:hypothetical protein
MNFRLPLKHVGPGFESHSRHGCLCVCIVLFVDSGFAAGWLSSKGSYGLCIGLRNWKSGQGSAKDCRVIIIIIIRRRRRRRSVQQWNLSPLRHLVSEVFSGSLFTTQMTSVGSLVCFLPYWIIKSLQSYKCVMNCPYIYFTLWKLDGVYTWILFYEICRKALNPNRQWDALQRPELLWELRSLSTELTNGWNGIYVYNVV